MNPLLFTATATHKRLDPPAVLTLGTLQVSDPRPARGGAGAVDEISRDKDAPVRFLQTFVQGEQTILRGDILEITGTAYRVNVCSPYPLRGWVINEVVLEDVLAAVFVETVIVRRPAKTPDGSGGRTVTWSTAATTKGRIFTHSQVAQEKVIADALASRQGYMVSLPAGTDVTRQDRLLIGSRILEVIAPIENSIQATTLVICAEVK